MVSPLYSLKLTVNFFKAVEIKKNANFRQFLYNPTETGLVTIVLKCVYY